MWEMTQGAARERLSPRERISQETLAFLRDTGTLVVDERRRRPLYFDGRFLAARDLTREQQYFLTRQADLGRATGAGVVHGLMVSVTADGGQLAIGAGHGVTDSGESVILPNALTVPLANVTTVQRLDVSFGIARRPTEPARNRSGLFVVALRPVEFTANPIASYPTSITDPRTVEDGDVVDGVVVSLIPYPDDGMQAELGMRRARAAREIFVQNTARGLPVDALPLAMVLLDRGVVRWLDVFMVRREVGSSHGDVLGFGFAPRAVREAHLVQYDNHLADVMRERAQANRGQKFAATEHFAALPPAGRMPVAAINTTDFTQSFFPPEIDVELSILPEDEIPALLEESILLPPIDLTTSGEALESTSVLVLLPVPRPHVRLVRYALAQAGQAELRRQIRSAAPGLIAQRRPLEILQGLRRVVEPAAQLPALPAGNPVDAAWTSMVVASGQRSGDTLWYVRRRNLQYRSDVVGTGVRLLTDDETQVDRVRAQLAGTPQRFAVEQFRAYATPAAFAEIMGLLGSPKVAGSKLLTLIAVYEVWNAFEAKQVLGQSPTQPRKPLTVPDIADISARWAAPELGDGMTQLEPAINAAIDAAGGTIPLPQLLNLQLLNLPPGLVPPFPIMPPGFVPQRLNMLAWSVATSKVVAHLDRIGDRLSGAAAALQLFAQQLVAAANDHNAVRTLITNKLADAGGAIAPPAPVTIVQPPPVTPTATTDAWAAQVKAMLADTGFASAIANLKAVCTPAAYPHVLTLYTTPKLIGSKILLSVAVFETAMMLTYKANSGQQLPLITVEDALQLAARFSDPNLGDGIAVVEQPILAAAGGGILRLQTLVGITTARAYYSLEYAGDRLKLTGNQEAITRFAAQVVYGARDRSTLFQVMSDAMSGVVSRWPGVPPTPAPVTEPASVSPAVTQDRLAQLKSRLAGSGWVEWLDYYKIISTEAAYADGIAFLAALPATASRLMLFAALQEVANAFETKRVPGSAPGVAPTVMPVTAEEVKQIATRWNEPGIVDGIAVLEPAIAAANGTDQARFAKLTGFIAESKRIGDLGRLGARLAGNQAAIDAFAAQLVAATTDIGTFNTLITTTLQS